MHHAVCITLYACLKGLQNNAINKDMSSVRKASHLATMNTKPMLRDQLNEVFGDFQHAVQQATQQTDDLIAGRMEPAQIEDPRFRGDLS